MSSSQENGYNQRQICHRSLDRAPLNQDLQSPGIIVTFVNICIRSARGGVYYDQRLGKTDSLASKAGRDNQEFRFQRSFT